MKFTLQAACGCHIGKVRKNNEDNLYFDDRCLELDHVGLKHPIVIETALRYGLSFAVFDGMGGENFGEYASFAAARKMQQTERFFTDYFISEKAYLQRLTEQLNQAVVDKKNDLRTRNMGTTMVCLYFSNRSVYVCNVGDSRAYRLRNREFLQLSADHVNKLPGRDDKKAPLSQYLGFDEEDIQIDPYIAKGSILPGDLYLLCSDGLTDMLTNFEISDIMLNYEDAGACVQALIQAALEHGGRDNITVIVCKIQ